MGEAVGPEDFIVLGQACNALDTMGVPFVVGGGTAVVEYGRDRRTKDFDLFLNREVLRAAMDALSGAGFTTTDTEKSWLYKAWRDGVLVDLIVLSRGGVRVDGEVLSHARMATQHGVTFRLMGPEDVLYRKALTLTEGRPDWYDGISIIERQGDALDWTYFLYRAQTYARRVLSFLLFTQTELHQPPQWPHASQDNLLYPGDTPGPVPQWVVFSLVRHVWLGEREAPGNTRRLTFTPRAA